jgi:low temperature requirement protein LtrA
MSESTVVTHGDATHGARLRTAMTARSPHEPHRASTPLELLFDLVFVVAISQAASGLHHAIAEAHALEGLIGYLMVFFAIWWAWMNFTWFASAYDCDDVPYRLAVFVQIAGALILAAGVPAMFDTHVPNMATLTGYVVMRLAIVAQWLRAAASDPDHRVTARRYAAGITIVQLAWVGMLWVPDLWVPGFLTLAAFELAVPVWAERAAPTTWHPQHIAERYGLLTLIVLGESILAATVAIQSALASGEAASALLLLIIGGLLIAYSMWWVYFDRPVHDLLTSLGKAIVGVTDTTLSLPPRLRWARGWPSAWTRPHITRRSARSAPAQPWRSLWRCTCCASGFFATGGVPPDPMVRPDNRGPRTAYAVYRLRRAARRCDSDRARCGEARAARAPGHLISRLLR